MEQTANDLYLAALAAPAHFKGDTLERLLLQRQLALSRKIREAIGSGTSQTAQLARLILEEAPSKRTPRLAYVNPGEEIFARRMEQGVMQVPDAAIIRRTDVLEAVLEILQAELSPAELQGTNDVV